MKLTMHKTYGPDSISPLELEEYAMTLDRPLLMFKISLSEGNVSSEWKMPNVVLSHDKK